MKNNDNNKKEKTKKILVGLIVILAIITLSAILLAVYIKGNDKEDEKELAYTELIKEISDKNVEEIEMTVGSTTAKVKLKNQEV